MGNEKLGLSPPMQTENGVDFFEISYFGKYSM